MLTGLPNNRHGDSGKDDFMIQCKQVIEQQQQHIDQLEQSIDRKDAIINDLLKKNKRKPQNEEINCHQMLEIDRFRQQVEYLSHDNQCLRIQLQERQKQIRSAIEEINNKQKDLQEGRGLLENLKEVYEAKIAKIMGEMKKKLSTEVTASLEKSKNRNLQPITPIKILSQNKIYPQYQANKSSRRTTFSTGKKTLINSPYLKEYRLDKFRAETDYSENQEPFGCQFQQNRIKSSNKIGIKQLLEKLSDKIGKLSKDE